MRAVKSTAVMRKSGWMLAALLLGVGQASAQSTMPAPDIFGVANWANSPQMRKFVDALPGLCGVTPPNGLGQCIPVASPDTTSFPGSDFYRIGLSDYTRQLHSDLPATKLRGYVQLDASGLPVGPNQYLGPLILATKGTPVRVLFTNNLGIGTAGDLFIPTDTTYMGAGDSNLCADGTPATPTSTCARMKYTQNRATLHLHGGNTPWISDGTPHQWTAPVGETSVLKKGVSARDVPDMPPSGDGQGTFYWTNQQSGRLMFFHDHAYGITRLNVYAGEAAGYLLVDPVEEAALAAATAPGTITATPDLAHLVPLVIQDKTFVPTDGGIATDPTWDAARYGGLGSLWFPHVYTPNQNPFDLSGANPFGRWDYGPWFWPPQNPATLVSPPVACTSIAYPGQTLTCPGTPNPSGTPESFMDTPVINGTAYPSLAVEPTAYRFQILSAGNDRTLNLGLYYAASKTDGTVCKAGNVFVAADCTEVSMVPALPPTTPCAATATGGAGLAIAALDGTGNPLNGTGLPAACWPSTWPTDGRDGGVPDPATAGPPIIQIGTEGGLLPAPAVIPSTPIGYEYNRRSITVLNIFTHGLLLGPAERADVIVDFSSVPTGSVLMLYNDAPAPVPAFDTRFDYYTGNLDQTATGGAPSTLAGFGPNTRTLMQIQVNGPTGTTFSLPALAAALPAAFVATQDKIIVPESAYPAGNGNGSNTYARIQDNQLSFWSGGPVGGLTLTNGGAGYTDVPAVSITGGGGSGAAGAVTLAATSIGSLTLTSGGGNYSSAPAVAISGGGGTGATATATLATQSVASATVTNGGKSYASVPTVTFSAPQTAGTTAAGTATVVNRRVTAITITNPGTGYTAAPTITISGGGGTGATATATLTTAAVASLTLTAPGSGFTSIPAVTFSGGGGSGAAATAALTPTVVATIALTSGGTGYTSAPAVAINPVNGAGAGATAVATPPVVPLLPKTIQELFTLDYGRMNATLGVELPFTNFLTQTTIPYGYVDPPTEIFKDGETQLWKITHNGVDTHFIHFHLVTVQVLNRVGWDGAIKPPDPNELSWKDTVRMNPLEDIVVALRPMLQTLPWKQPVSVRPLDVTEPVGYTSTMSFTNVDPGNFPAAVINDLTNFGYEYVWHCHILGHEENDMMRAVAFVVPPNTPTLATIALQGTGKGQSIVLTWTDGATVDRSGFTIQRATSSAGPWTNIASVGPSVFTYTDATVARRTTYFYQVLANNRVGYTRPYAAPAVGYPTVQSDSPPSNGLSVATN